MEASTECTSLIFTCCLVNEYGHDIADILNRTARYNAVAGTHTMMLSVHGNLIQAIEGNPLCVSQAWQHICNDVRYFDQRKRHEERVAGPSFKGTHAGLWNYPMVAKDTILGEVDLFSLALQEVESRIQAGSARQLLLEFTRDFA